MSFCLKEEATGDLESAQGPSMWRNKSIGRAQLTLESEIQSKKTGSDQEPILEGEMCYGCGNLLDLLFML